MEACAFNLSEALVIGGSENMVMAILTYGK